MQADRRMYSESRASALLKLQAALDPSIEAYVTGLKTKFKKYQMPVEQGRRLIDEAMGSRALTDLLYEVRQERV